MADCVDAAGMFAAYAESARALDDWHDGGQVGERPPGRLRRLQPPELGRLERAAALGALPGPARPRRPPPTPAPQGRLLSTPRRPVTEVRPRCAEPSQKCVQPALLRRLTRPLVHFCDGSAGLRGQRGTRRGVASAVAQVRAACRRTRSRLPQSAELHQRRRWPRLVSTYAQPHAGSAQRSTGPGGLVSWSSRSSATRWAGAALVRVVTSHCARSPRWTRSLCCKRVVDERAEPLEVGPVGVGEVPGQRRAQGQQGRADVEAVQLRGLLVRHDAGAAAPDQAVLGARQVVLAARVVAAPADGVDQVEAGPTTDQMHGRDAGADRGHGCHSNGFAHLKPLG